MSNGTSSCPTVTLPFGLFSATPTIAPLEPGDIPPADPPPGLEQFVLDNSPTEGSALDGFDLAFSEAVGIVDALEAALNGLGNDLLLAFTEADAIDATPVGDTVAGYTAALVPVGTAVDDLGTLLSTITPPTPTPVTCGKGGPGSPAPCGTHGQSSITLNDDTINCFAADALPVVSIRDGACTFVIPVDGTNFPGKTGVSAVALLSGDARLFSATNDTVPGKTAGTCDSRVLFKLSPYRTGHYLGKFTVKTDRNPNGEIWCVIVDVIA
jgi:hypothetical protein